jgi:hypothetical protein
MIHPRNHVNQQAGPAVSTSSRRLPSILTIQELVAYGRSPRSVQHMWPEAVEYTTLDGRPCWLLRDICGDAE